MPGYPDLPDSLTAADAAKPLLQVPRQEELAASFSPDNAANLTTAAVTLHNVLEPYLPPPVGVLTESVVSCLAEPQDTLRAGTVVLVRRTDVLTEQYVLPRVYVDLKTGRKYVKNPVAPPAPQLAASKNRGIRPLATPQGVGIAKGVFGFLGSVTPFIPPPYGVVATAVVSIVNILLDLAEGAPTGPNPFERVVTEITNYIATDDLKNLGQTPLTNVTTQMQNMLKLLDVPFDQMTKIDADLATLWTYIDGGRRDAYFLGEGVQQVDTANSFLWETLQTQDDQNFGATLALLVRGVTLQLILYKMSVQLRTLSGHVYYVENAMTSFNRETETWHSQLRRIAKDIGMPDSGGSTAVKGADPTTGLPSGTALAGFTQDDIDSGLASTSWIPRIFAWAAKIRRNRLALIDSSVTRHWEKNDGRGAAEFPNFHGWSWRDSRLSNDDGGIHENTVWDTDGSGCCDAMVQHQETAEQKRLGYVASVASALDISLSPHLLSALSWVTFVQNFESLLPVASSTNPLTATMLPGGPATPLPPTWASGNVVRYQVAAVNQQGPAPAGPWSNELAVTSIVGARVNGIAAPVGSSALWLYRQVRMPGQSWMTAPEAEAVMIIPPGDSGAFPSSIDDKEPGQ